jgi:hypothetical protein
MTVATSILIALLFIWVLLSALFLVAVCMVSSRMSQAQESRENGVVPQPIVMHKPAAWDYTSEPGRASFAK